MGDQQFFLKWNDFQTNMVTSFRHLRDEKSFTDVTLACEGQTCKAHKMVLSACSPYFKSLLEYRKLTNLSLSTSRLPAQNLCIGRQDFCQLVTPFVESKNIDDVNCRLLIIGYATQGLVSELLYRVELENPSKHPIIILKDVSYLHLQAILEFMYAGEVNVSQEQLPAFLKTAARLKVKGLAEPPPQMPSIKREG